tara:strand:+ start:14317 stop:14706 length:390 start_codon:yes stop_codon:yes gene_type:complete
MNQSKTYNILTYFIASVWFVNGLFCKVLNLVPRHQEIVARILGSHNSEIITIIIGILEIIMTIWILTNYKSKLNALTQIIILATMNIIEFMFAKDLLLWGKFNSLFAILFILIVYYTNFKTQEKHVIKT